MTVRGLTQGEIREEVRSRGLTEYPEIALLGALSAVAANAETIRVLRATKAPRKLWKLNLRLPKTDGLFVRDRRGDDVEKPGRGDERYRRGRTETA